jgi:hypothetical protein
MTSQTIEGYNPSEHLVKIKSKDGTLKDYLPACWRLYELSLRYPNANFSSELVHVNEERDFVIVKARLYLGASYEDSDRKAEAFKQGKLSMLDKVETAAKARAARDFGIGTEHALDFEEATIDEPPVERKAEAPTPMNLKSLPAQPVVDGAKRAKLNELLELGQQLGVFSKRSGLANYASKVLVREIGVDQLVQLTEGDLAEIESMLHSEEPEPVAERN